MFDTFELVPRGPNVASQCPGLYDTFYGTVFTGNFDGTDGTVNCLFAGFGFVGVHTK